MSYDNKTDITIRSAKTENKKIGNAATLILQSISQYPDQIALINGNISLSYTAFKQHVASVQQQLMQAGIGRGDVVGLLLRRDQWLIPSMVAVLASGATFVPLDFTYPLPRLEQYVDVAKPTLLISHPSNTILAQQLHKNTIYPILSEVSDIVCLEMQDDELAYILFTSGSTGLPKGVSIGHNALCNFFTSITDRLGIQTSQVFLAHTTVAFDISILELLLPLTVGGTVLLAQNEEINEIEHILPLIVKSHFVQATPSLWKILLAAGWQPDASVTILSGGEALPLTLATKINQTCRQLWNLYGPTETTIWTSCEQVKQNATFISIGEPLANTQLHILDDKLQQCEQGELYISGLGLAQGYYGNPEGTAKAFFVHPQTGIRLYRSGDRVRIREHGKLEWLGRGDDEVKIRGNRIGVKEIEHELEKIPGVIGAVVAAKSFEGHGDDMLTAYVISQTVLLKISLEQALREKLPAYMVPDQFVVLPDFPLLPNGKLDRKSLPNPTRNNTLHHQINSVQHALSDKHYQMIVNTICEVFSITLGQSKFDETSSFFDLGGNSALAVISAGMISSKLKKKISVALITAAESPIVLAEKILQISE